MRTYLSRGIRKHIFPKTAIFVPSNASKFFPGPPFSTTGNEPRVDLPLHIVKKKGKPKTLQIKEQVIKLIEEGYLKDGDFLPTLEQMAKRHHISQETVVLAFMGLRSELYLYPVKGKGYYVWNRNRN